MLRKKKNPCVPDGNPSRKKAKVIDAATKDQSDTGFDSLNDDTLCQVFQFVGKNSYRNFGLINKRCNQMYDVCDVLKRTSLYGYGNIPMIEEKLHYLLAAKAQENHETEYRYLPAQSRLARSILFYNRYDIIDYLMGDPDFTDFTSELGNEAALQGRKDVLVYLFENLDEEMLMPLKTDRYLCARASEGDHFELLKWLREENGCCLDRWPYDGTAATYPAQRGDMDMLKYMYENGCLVNYGTIASAAKGGHIHVIEWLLSVGCSFDKYCCEEAANGCQLKTLKWLRNRGCPWNINECAKSAAYGGQLNVLQWLHEDMGCVLNERIYSWASNGENIDMYLWLKSKGFPWNMTATTKAAQMGSLILLQFLVDRGCPLDHEICCRLAAYRGQLEMLKWLKPRVSHWDSRNFLTDSMITGYHEETTHWLEAEANTVQVATRGASEPNPN